jgi:alkyl hydroperoxide reductase subunit AhpC
MSTLIGKQAPDFNLPAVVNGEISSLNTETEAGKYL